MAAKRDLVLTQYPVVDRLRVKLAKEIDGDLQYLIISTIAAGGYVELIRHLRRTDLNNVYVLITDRTVLPLKSILKLISFFSKAKRRYLIVPDEPIAQFGLASFIFDASKLFLTLLWGGISLVFFTCRAATLLSLPRIHLHASDPKVTNDTYAYLKSNLWLGVQAGGAITHTWGVVRGLLFRGGKVAFLSADARGYKGEKGLAHLPVEPDFPYVIPRELNHFLYHRTFTKKSIALLNDRYKAIYQRMSIGNFAGVEITRHLRCPLILEYNGSENWLAKNWGTPFLFSKLVGLAERVSLRHAHVIATVSEPLKDELVQRGIDEDRIVVHPNGVDPALFEPSAFTQREIAEIRHKMGVPDHGVLISFVGTFGPWHGAEKFASAAKKLINSDTGNNEAEEYFLFIGDGVRRPEVEAFAGDLIKNGRVILTGLVDPTAIPSYLAASDILVSPTVRNPDKSPFFGSPTKLFEYMAAGKPIIASKIGQIEEVMAGSRTVDDLGSAKSELDDSSDDGIGILTAPGDVDELCTAIRFLSVNPKYRTKWGAAARQRVLSRYTWDHHVNAITNKLEEVVANERTRKIRVLINGLHSKSGGGVTYLRNILPILCADPRLDIHLCLNEKQMTLFEPWLGQATLHKVMLDDSLWRTIGYEQFSLPRLAREIQADVTFSPANYGPLFAPRTVVLLRNALSVAFVERRLPKILYWFMLYLGTLLSVFAARNVISVSEYARKATVAGVFGWAPDRFHTIPHGISRNFEADVTIKREANSLLFVSDIYVQKNLHGFFKSLSILKKQFPDIKLRVAGAPVDSDYDERIRALMHELQLDDAVEFLGNLDPVQLTHEYRRATVFVFPSTVETFGNPLVEAMACGAPIACSNTAAMPEVASEAAEYFDPYDAEDMARVVEKLLNDEERREELSGLGIERAEIYSWEETARKTADVLIDAARN